MSSEKEMLCTYTTQGSHFSELPVVLAFLNLLFLFFFLFVAHL